jgi:hypothetical protein
MMPVMRMVRSSKRVLLLNARAKLQRIQIRVRAKRAQSIAILWQLQHSLGRPIRDAFPVEREEESRNLVANRITRDTTHRTSHSRRRGREGLRIHRCRRQIAAL